MEVVYVLLLDDCQKDIAEVITRAHLVGFTDLAKDCLHT